MTVTNFRPIADEWTIDELERLPRGTRAEVHNGNLFVLPPASLWHQHTVDMLCNFLPKAGRFAFTRVGVLNTPRALGRPRHDVRIATTLAGNTEYVERHRATLADLER